jgi:heme/copper-type cytochrome/quinol oxidase subunit 2
LAITWKAALAIVLVAPAALVSWAPGAREELAAGPDRPLSIVLTGRAGRWHADARGRASAAGDIRLPAGAEVELTLRSEDYVYTFSVPALGLNEVAVPEISATRAIHTPRSGCYPVDAGPLCGRPTIHRYRLVFGPRP